MREPINHEKRTAAALLRSRGHSEMEIAKILGISQGSVPKCLKWAKEQGYLKVPSPQFEIERVPKELMARVSSLVDHVGLSEAIETMIRASPRKDAFAPVVRVFPSGSRNTGDVIWNKRLQRFGQASAPSILALLRRAKRVGVSWGSTAASVVSAIEATRTAESPHTRVVPLGGEPLGAPLNLASSSTLAARLQLALGGGGNTLSLAAVPALIPLTFKTKSEINTVKSLVRLVRDYQTVYLGRVGQPPLAGELDGILCSASQAGRVWGEDLLQSGEFDESDLIDLVHGDICGVLIAQDGKEKNVARLRARWTCLQEHHLSTCAKRAAADKSLPGIILACIGANKAKCVFECVRRGYVNQLFIDDDLADELEKQTRNWLKRAGKSGAASALR